MESFPFHFAKATIVSWHRGLLVVKRLGLRDLPHMLGLVGVTRPDVAPMMPTRLG